LGRAVSLVKLFGPEHMPHMNVQGGTSILSVYSIAANPGGLAGMIIAIIGTTIVVISIIGSSLLVNRGALDQQRETKILLFLLYFWMLAFVQLIVFAIGYWAITR
jgi:hypothetical protein